MFEDLLAHTLSCPNNNTAQELSAKLQLQM